MIVGVPKEIKVHESRVAITPEGVSEFVALGHTVLIEDGAGLGSAITNGDFVAAGAVIVDTADQVWQQSEMILKVKEPIEIEYSRMKRGQILFTYLHLAASRACTDAIIASGSTAIAYETVEVNGSLPLLAPMSEVAGRLATQVGATALQKPNGGRGVLLGGVPGVAPGRVVIIGAGVAGLNAAVIAVGMGAEVTVFDRSISRLAFIDTVYAGRIRTLVASAHAIEREVRLADLVIGAVLVHGAKAPKLVSNALVKSMKHGSVLVDIAIDQGGCFEDSRPTTHAEPTYMVHDSVFYCVANMPGAVPVAST
ncbi:MAG: alanine dehydrogenase, partial [Actinobacteria bacterium]|nr:alanine dehydrogenase [Actinomycetota bacterium]